MYRIRLVYGVRCVGTRQLDDNDFGKSSKSASTSSAKRSQSKKRKLAVIMVDGVETEVRYMD